MVDCQRDMLAVEAAEARGDAEAALAVMSRRPTMPDGSLFWRPWRVHSLVQLACMGDQLPAWVTSRWVVDQAHASTRGGDERVRRAMAEAIDLRGGEGRLPGHGPLDRRVQVLDHDWVFRQLYLYDLGGLRHFVDGTASPGLLAAADHIQEWVDAPMSAFRLARRERHELVWLDLASGEQVVTPNLGAVAVSAESPHVLARAVPVTGGTIFESAPLPVDPETAMAVAACPTDWLSALAQARARGADLPLHQPPTGLVVDVPPDIWRCVIADPDPDGDPATSLVEALQPEALARAIPALVCQLVELDDEGEADDWEPPPGVTPDTVGYDVWACVAAAVCHPEIHHELSSLANDPWVREVLELMARVLAEPAASLCRLALSTPAPGFEPGSRTGSRPGPPSDPRSVAG